MAAPEPAGPGTKGQQGGAHQAWGGALARLAGSTLLPVAPLGSSTAVVATGAGALLGAPPAPNMFAAGSAPGTCSTSCDQQWWAGGRWHWPVAALPASCSARSAVAVSTPSTGHACSSAFRNLASTRPWGRRQGWRVCAQAASMFWFRLVLPRHTTTTTTVRGGEASQNGRRWRRPGEEPRMAGKEGER